MRFGALTAGLVGALALATVAHDASAQSRTRAPAVTLSEAASASSSTTPAQRRGLRLNENGRWGLNFNMNQPTGRDTHWGDVEAGASYSVTPRLSVGAAAALGRAEQDPARAAETDRRAQPRIRLESIFRF